MVSIVAKKHFFWKSQKRSLHQNFKNGPNIDQKIVCADIFIFMPGQENKKLQLIIIFDIFDTLDPCNENIGIFHLSICSYLAAIFNNN